MRHFPHLKTAALFLVALSALVPDLQAQDDVNWVDRLLPNTVLFARMDNARKFEALAKNSPMYKFLQDPACESMRKRVDAVVDELFGNLPEGIDPWKLASAVDGEITFGISITGPDDAPEILAYFVAEVGQDLESFRDEWNRMVDEMTKDLDVRFEKDDGLEITSWQDESGRIEQTFLNDILIITASDIQNASGLDAVLNFLGGQTPGSLSDNPRFQRHFPNQDAEPLTLWVDGPAIVQSLSEDILAELGEDADALEAMGFSALESGCLEFRVDGGEYLTELEIFCEGEGFLPSYLNQIFQPTSLKLLDYSAADSRNVSIFGIDIDQALKVMLNFAGTIDPTVAGQGEAMMQEADNALGLNLSQDLMAHLGREFAMISPPRESQEFLDPDDPFQALEDFGVLAMSLKDGEAFKASIDKILRNFGYHAIRKRSEFMGFEVFSIPVPLASISIYYSLQPTVGLIALEPGDLEACLRRMGSEDLPSLAKDESIKSWIEKMGTQPYGFSTWDSVDYAWEIASMVSQVLGVDLLALPELGSIPDIFADLPSDRSLIEKYFEGRGMGFMKRDESLHRLTLVW